MASGFCWGCVLSFQLGEVCEEEIPDEALLADVVFFSQFSYSFAEFGGQAKLDYSVSWSGNVSGV